MDGNAAPSVLLVTGGAGYIGSHVARACLAAGHQVVVLDDLSTGDLRNIPANADFVGGDIRDADLVRRTLRRHHIGGVIHLAGRLVAAESVADPVGYYETNSLGSLALGSACAAEGVSSFVYSSSAAVYGQPPGGRVAETAPLAPINPYGRSKLFAERMLADLAKVSDLRVIALRYFNVAGVDASLQSGPRNPGARSLFKALCDTILGYQAVLDIFGDDCATPDGSCIRDFIDVRDLASVHVAALARLRGGHAGGAFNCGYGRGVSVLQVVRAAEELIGRRIPVRLHPRRDFDPEEVVADPGRLNAELGWTPQHGDLRSMIRTTLDWEARLAAKVPA